jgi:CubicO group peptidase (beta-lactamase class C family)
MMGEPYFPTPESLGGWRWLGDAAEVRSVAGMDAQALDQLARGQELIFGGDSWAIVIIRHGYLVREYYTFNVLVPTRFDVWSSTKSFTGTAWGMLLEDSRCGRLPGGAKVDLDSLAYEFIPPMTSRIPGEGVGVIGIPTATRYGPFEHALGQAPNRYGMWASKLCAEPGSSWDYSDPAIAHLALAFVHLAGEEMHEYLEQRLFQPIGIENLSWDVQGGSGFIGPHTNAHTGVHVSAREMARFGYLMLQGGKWDGQQLVPEWWIRLATRSSQDMYPRYGYTWWVNANGASWPSLPHDIFYSWGYRSNLCYVVPSLDLVVARVGSGPPAWNEQELIAGVIAAIRDD